MRRTSAAALSPERMSGAEIALHALKACGVDTVFGYPGGAVLPLYDALFRQNSIKHVLVRHEQAAVHAAEGYARSTGRPGVVFVTSGPGATNAITGLTDALLDSIPVVCLSGQVATHLIGTDAFQEANTVGLTRAATKYNCLVDDTADLAAAIYKAFEIATSGRPGPVLVDIPKDVQVNEAAYPSPYRSVLRPAEIKLDEGIRDAVALIDAARRPLLYTGGGVINSGPEASALLRKLLSVTEFPVTSTLLGLGAVPASHPQFLGMTGMHGTYEANMAMHDCDLMINVGARFDDRVTGRLDAFSPNSKKIHIDIDQSSIGKLVPVDVGLVGDAAAVLRALLCGLAEIQIERRTEWWNQIARWRSRGCLRYSPRSDVILPQYAIQRLHALTAHLRPIITTEVGQHQMWAAQYFGIEEPRRWLTSGGLGTMGYGFPAAIGAQMAHPDALVIDIAGEASIQMNIQELSTAIQYRLPVKIFIVNNEYMGMVRQWQELNHGSRYSESYSAALPDFVKLAEAYGAVGLRVTSPDELDGAIREMIAVPRPVVFDCRVAKLENCLPMIPAGAPHNEMILPDDALPSDAPIDRQILL